MKLKLSVVQSQGGSWADVTEHGTFRSQLEKTDTLFLSNKNIEKDRNEDGKYNRVVVFIKGTDDVVKMMPVSERLSKTVRKALANGMKQSQVLKSLMGFRIIENEDGRFFIAPDGKPGEQLTVAQLDKGEAVPMEDFIA